jgi:hypothetical protein
MVNDSTPQIAAFFVACAFGGGGFSGGARQSQTTVAARQEAGQGPRFIPVVVCCYHAMPPFKKYSVFIGSNS